MSKAAVGVRIAACSPSVVKDASTRHACESALRSLALRAVVSRNSSQSCGDEPSRRKVVRPRGKRTPERQCDRPSLLPLAQEIKDREAHKGKDGERWREQARQREAAITLALGARTTPRLDQPPADYGQVS